MNHDANHTNHMNHINHVNRVRASVLLSTMLLPLIGCSTKRDGEPVDYGPETTIEALENALTAPIAGIDPTQAKIGSFVHIAQVQELAGGKVSSIVADTGQTVVGRDESESEVQYTIVQHRITYGQQTNKVSTELKIAFTKAKDTETETVSSFAFANFMNFANLVNFVNSGRLRQLASSGSRLSYHNLRVSQATVAPPLLVQQAPDCLGIPDCKIRLHTVSFDQVLWSGDQNERIHFDMSISPDIPALAGLEMSPLFHYFPGLMSSCVTLMVPIGDGRAKTLLRECQEIVNFREQGTQ